MNRPHVKPLAVLLAAAASALFALRARSLGRAEPGRAEAGRGCSGSEREADLPALLQAHRRPARALGGRDEARRRARPAAAIVAGRDHAGRRDDRRHPEPRARSSTGKDVSADQDVVPRAAADPAEQLDRLGAGERARRPLHGQHAPLRRPREADGDAEARRRDVFKTIVGVGKSNWPTPRGEFYVRDKLTASATPSTGRSRSARAPARPTLTDWPGGGFVGVHGTNEPQILPGPRLARLHPHAERVDPEARAADAGRHAADRSASAGERPTGSSRGSCPASPRSARPGSPCPRRA